MDAAARSAARAAPRAHPRGALMTAEKPSCPRTFEVEAARDGRLGGAERQRFRAHARHCAACAREAQAFEQLAGALRALPAVSADDLHVRRERVRLLGAFDAALV